MRRRSERRDRQAEVARLGLIAISNRSLAELMSDAVDVVVEGLNVAFCKILVLQPDGESFRLHAGIGWEDKRWLTVPAGPEDSQAGYTLATSEPVVVEDVYNESRFAVESILADRVRSGISVLIEGTNEPFGVLVAHASEKRRYTKDDIHFLQNVANILAAAIERHRVEEQLQESELRAQAVLDTTVDGIITINAYGRIESINPAVERIFGFAAEELIGQNVKILMPQPYRDEHDEYLRSYRETGRRKIIGIGREVAGCRKDGTVFPLEIAISEVSLGERKIFTGIVRDVTERRKLEQEILSVSEQERRRIGQDLHDGLGQMLTGIGLIARNLARKLDRENDPHTEDVAEIADLVQEADEFARGLARGLVPVELEAGGLRSALQRLAHGAEKLFGIRCTFEAIGSVLVENNSVATHLYRITQEALSNAVRHGKATHVKISLASGENQLRLRIMDDGTGFDPNEAEMGGGMGVRIMGHRARIIGAHLEIGPGSAGGTTVTCTLPNHPSAVAVGGEEYGRTATANSV